MKVMKLVVFAVLAICVASCGGKKGSNDSEQIIVKPIETTVSGDMEGCFTVVDKEYKTTGAWANGIITVELERTDQELPFELNGRELLPFSTSDASANVQVGFGIEFLDADGNIVDKVSADGSGISESYDSEEAVALCKLKPGEKGTIRFTVNSEAKDAVCFRITTAYEENEGSDEETSEGIESSISDDDDYQGSNLSSESGSEDWDALLDSYDSFVTKYISFMKKAAKGDASAMAEYPSLMEKVQEYSNRISGAQGEMSASQWARYMKITSKMTTAVQNMQ